MRLLSRFEDETFLKKFGTYALYALLGIGLVALLWSFIPRARAADKGGSGKTGIQAIDDVTASTGWSGIYFGAGAGYQIADTNLALGVDAPPGFTGNLLEIDGLSGRGWAYDGRLGADWHIPSTPFVVGIFGGYAGGETEFSVNTDIAAVGNILNMTVRQDWYAGGRLGLVYGKSLFYGGYAWTQGEFNVSVPAAPTLCATPAVPGLFSISCNQDIEGRMILAGVEVMLAPQLTLGAEYTLTQYETANIVSLGAAPGPTAGLDADPDVHAFKVRLNWRPFSK